MPRESNPGALQGDQIAWLAEPFGGWVSPTSSTSGGVHFLASVEGVQASTLIKDATDQYAESAGVTLFQSEKFGHIAPGNGYTAATDAAPRVNDIPVNGGVESTNQEGIMVLANGRICMTAEGGTSIDQTYYYDPTDSSTRTGTAGSKNNDMILFRDNANEWVVWSYDYASGANADIAIAYSKNLTSPLDTWYSSLSGATALTGGVPHKIVKGPDGNIYITDGPYVRQIVVAGSSALTGATIGQVLNVGTGWTTTGISYYKNFVAIIASDKVSDYSYGHTRVFLWDGMTTTVSGITSVAANNIYDIPDNFGNGIHFDGNILRIFTSGRNNSSKILELTSKGFVKVFETPFIPATSGTSPGFLQGSVDDYQDSLIIAAVKGDTYGHLFRLYGSGFHDEGYLCDGDTLTGNMATSVGMCKNLFSNIFFVGVKYGTTYKLFYKNPNSYQTSTATTGGTIDLRSILYTKGLMGRRLYPMGFKMTVNRIRIYFSQWGTGAAIYLSAFRDYDTFLPGNTDSANGGVDRLNYLIDTDSTTPNGFITGTNPGGYTVGYWHQCLAAGTPFIDIDDTAITDVSGFYVNIRWKHATTTAQAAIIRMMVFQFAQSQ